ncbi:MAG: ATP-binding protein [Bacteroidales bacterium]|nr:ATP-binding protein [Bacteroidales bacterium]
MFDFIERDLAATLLDASQYFPVLCVTGPRQSGKSTLIKHIFNGYRRFTLEDYDVRSLAQNDPLGFLNQTNGGMIIDEVQRVPELLSYIQGIVDDRPERRFVLSGSSNFLLLKTVSQSLAGRAGVFELLPMSLSEAKEAYAEKTLDEIIYNGCFPAVCAGKNVAKYLYPAYTKTYIDKDLRQLININNLSQFHTFLRLCAARIGSIFNASELAGEVGVASNTINAWVSVLEASYIIMRLQPWSENSRKRLTKSPKLYFCDTGLACHLLDIESPEQLSRDKMRGHLFENLIVMEALKQRYNKGKESNIFFFRDAKGNEIDLLIREAGELKAIEIKSSQTYAPSFEDVLKKSGSLLTTPVSKRAVVYAGNMENAAADIALLNYRNFCSL